MGYPKLACGHPAECCTVCAGGVDICNWCTDVERLRALVQELVSAATLAQEWSAGYPLGGGHDDVAATDVYNHCSAITEKVRKVLDE